MRSARPVRPFGGTGRSSIGQTGSPVARSKTNTNPCFGRLGDGFDGPAIDDDVGENRRARQVPIPHIMMNGLKVPDPLTRMEIERDEAIGEQIVSVPVTAVVVARRHLDGQIDDAQLFVYGDLCPHSRVARVLPGVVQPSVIAELARPRERVEDPEALAGSGVETSEVTFGLLLGRGGIPNQMRGADEDDAVGDNGSGVKSDLPGDGIELLIESLLQVDDPVVAEARDGSTGFRRRARSSGSPA